MIQQFDHAALSVADLERSLRFYRDLLGLRVARILEPDPALPLGKVVGMPDAAARIAHLMLDGVMIELFEYQRPVGEPIPPSRSQADHGCIHIGLRSDDVRGDYTRLKAEGVRFLSEPVEFRPGVWIVYFYGPDAEVIELRETPEESHECICGEPPDGPAADG
jgi:catechol 2,3-dioxygenase-like lactoylglutathione lyase family enzyme